MAKIDVIYVEEAVRSHPRVTEIIERVRPKHVVECEHYGEIFNRKRQDFREQKSAPALILAEKSGRRVLSAPEGYGIGGKKNFYFSHMLNCVFDCRYCFLQGMYPSAHYVLFLNYEDFIADIETTLAEHGPDEDLYFYSGYDCDSLALERYSAFVAHYLPHFRRWPNAHVELRTKSVNIAPLTAIERTNTIVAELDATGDRGSSGSEDAERSSTFRSSREIAKIRLANWITFRPSYRDRGLGVALPHVDRAV